MYAHAQEFFARKKPGFSAKAGLLAHDYMSNNM
jgi:hypothetical protein